MRDRRVCGPGGEELADGLAAGEAAALSGHGDRAPEERVYGAGNVGLGRREQSELSVSFMGVFVGMRVLLFCCVAACRVVGLM